MSSPPNSMRPFQGATNDMMVFSKVVLPAPLAPSSTTVSFSWMQRSTPHRTCMRRYPAVMPERARSGAGSGGMLASEKDFDHLRVPGSFREPALENLLARIHDNDAVGDLVDETHQMLDHQQRNSAFRQFFHFLRHAIELRWIESGGEFVDEQQPRAGRQRSRQVKHLLLRAVEIAGRLI